LVAAKKDAVLAAGGKLACEACTFIFEDKYGELGKNYCEVHHRKPFAVGHIRQTSLSDLAILCSNCHRMIHRTDPMLSVEEFRETWINLHYAKANG
jgi:5-methylcytosine-specific restriction protein A